METTRFDQIGKLFAQRRLSRRQALYQSGTGIAVAGLAVAGVRATLAQDATPAPGASPTAGGTASTAEFLFLQSFESGTIAPKDGADGTYTLTLQHGLGQTIYFSDRPERVVGAAPTPQFLDGLGFSADNPPNAALVVDSADGGVDIAVIELTNPVYDVGSSTATYDAAVLKDYSEVDLQFQEAPSDLAALAATFGSAHLFIDDCADRLVTCEHWDGNRYVTEDGTRSLGNQGFCWSWSTFRCDECDPNAYKQACYNQFPDFCNNDHDCEPVAAN